MFKEIFNRSFRITYVGRLLKREFDADMHEDFTDSDRNSICFLGGRIYSVQTCRIHYTSYDIQRQCDTINPARIRTSC